MQRLPAGGPRVAWALLWAPFTSFHKPKIAINKPKQVSRGEIRSIWHTSTSIDNSSGLYICTSTFISLVSVRVIHLGLRSWGSNAARKDQNFADPCVKASVLSRIQWDRLRDTRHGHRQWSHEFEEHGTQCVIYTPHCLNKSLNSYSEASLCLVCRTTAVSLQFCRSSRWRFGNHCLLCKMSRRILKTGADFVQYIFRDHSEFWYCTVLRPITAPVPS
jgi:hypothetical protein